MKEFSIDRNTEGQRIDRYLSDELEDRSRSYIQKIMKEGYVKVNQKPVKSNYRLSFGDSVSDRPSPSFWLLSLLSAS